MWVCHVGHQLQVPVDALVRRDDRLAHGVDRLQGRLDLTQLDSEAPDLDLEVASAEELDVAIGKVASQVAGLVENPAGPEGIVHEALGGELGAVEVATANLHPADVKLSGGPHGQGLHFVVEDVNLCVCHRFADGHEGQGTCRVAGPRGHIDGSLGRPVQVVQGGSAALVETILQRPGQGLATADDADEAGAGGGPWVLQEQLQHRRHEVDGGDATLHDGLCQVPAIAVTPWLCHHQLGTEEQRPEELPHRNVEAEGRLLQDLVVGGQAEVLLHPQDAVHDGPVRDHRPLGLTGRAGRVDDVGKVI